MNVARSTPVAAIGLMLGLLVVAIAPAPAAAARAESRSERWIVAVGRAGGSTIGPRSVSSPLPRLRAIPGDPAARREVNRLVRAGGIRPSAIYRNAFDGFAASLTRAQVAALRRDPAVAVLVADRPTRVEQTTAGSGARQSRIEGSMTPTGIRRVRADTGPLSRIDGVDDRLDVDVAIIDTGIAPSPELRIAGGFDCTSDDPEAWRDGDGHGTHVAGTLAARDDGRGVVGVAPGARLWAIKIFDDGGRGLLSQQLCGLDRVLGMRDPDDASRPRIEVVNLSIGQWLMAADDRDCGRLVGDLVHGAICALVVDGVTVVAAAGNQSVNAARRTPAAYDEVITVSALADFDGRPGGLGRQADICPGNSIDTDDSYGNFSNFGPDVDIIAPGKCILSTLPRGRFGLSTGTSMATPHVAGAAALLAAAHPGATPGQIRAALLHAATDDWAFGTDPDPIHDSLLDVSRLRTLPDLAVVAGDPTDELARGGVTRLDVTLERSGGHVGPVEVRAIGLPDGIIAEAAPSPTRGSDVTLWLHAATDAAGGTQAFTIRATDGDLVRTTSATVRVRAGGPTIGFDAPDGGADGLRITDDDAVTVAFTESTPGARPADRRVLRQAGPPVTPGSCADVDWAPVGDAATPGELDPGGSPESGWSLSVDLGGDGCTRWLVRLTDEDGGSARFASPAVLRDTLRPSPPVVRASGEGVWQRGTGTVWVRAGSGSLVLDAGGRDGGSGVVGHTFGPLSDGTGWTLEPRADDGGSRLALDWSTAAVATSLEVTATDATGRTGGARSVQVRVDGSVPRSSGWREPESGTFERASDEPELTWRPLADDGSGVAVLQFVQRQMARPVGDRCRGVVWEDDGPIQRVALHDEQWDVRSGRCYRWILVPVDRVGNVGQRVVSGTLLTDLFAPKADFLAPDEGTQTTINTTTFRVAWTERRRVGGGSTSRRLERERVWAGDGPCPATGWVPQGRAETGRSPIQASGLRPGWCYRWRLNLADDHDNVSAELSGTVKVARTT